MAENKNPHLFLTDEAQIRTVESLRRVDEAGRLYYMECGWNYYEMPDAFAALLAPQPGCSVFSVKNLQGEQMLCRNYDYSHRLHNDKNNPITGINVIVHGKNPAAKYESLSVSDAYWLDMKTWSLVEGMGDDGKTDISLFAMAPYVCMDGMNSAGLGVSILALGTEPEWDETDFDTWQQQAEASGEEPKIFEESGVEPDKKDLRSKIGTVAVNKADKKAWVCHRHSLRQNNPGRRTVYHPIMMRFMLDNAGSVDEAIAMTNMFNICSPLPDWDYHVFLTDVSGKSVVLEWQKGEMTVIELNHATNYYVSREDRLGGGHERDEVIAAAINRFPNGMTEQVSKAVLQIVAQYPEYKNKENRIEGMTQYSDIFNLTNRTMKIWSFGDFEKCWEYRL